VANERKTTTAMSGERLSGQTMGNATTSDDAMAKVLGAAVIDAWAELPREIQEMLFERAVANGHGDALRHDLALFLHERHPRTAEH
jgi:hypothetical protein